MKSPMSRCPCAALRHENDFEVILLDGAWVNWPGSSTLPMSYANVTTTMAAVFIPRLVCVEVILGFLGFSGARLMNRAGGRHGRGDAAAHHARTGPAPATGWPEPPGERDR